MALSSTTRIIVVASLLTATSLIVGCDDPPPGGHDAGDADVEGSDAWDGGPQDADVDGDYDSQTETGPGLSGSVEILPDETSGTVIIEITPAWEDGEADIGLHPPEVAGRLMSTISDAQGARP